MSKSETQQEADCMKNKSLTIDGQKASKSHRKDRKVKDAHLILNSDKK